MGKNRKVSVRRDVMIGATARFGALLVVLFVMVIINVLASSSCQQLMKRIGAGERELASLEAARNREANRWDLLKTPERIEAALLRHGLSMKPPRADQNIYMTAEGKPLLGQSSLALVRRRNEGRTAQYRGRSR